MPGLSFPDNRLQESGQRRQNRPDREQDEGKRPPSVEMLRATTLDLASQETPGQTQWSEPVALDQRARRPVGSETTEALN